MQIDKAGEFYGRIFPKDFIFTENEMRAENDYQLEELFYNHRIARKKGYSIYIACNCKRIIKYDQWHQSRQHLCCRY